MSQTCHSSLELDIGFPLNISKLKRIGSHSFYSFITRTGQTCAAFAILLLPDDTGTLLSIHAMKLALVLATKIFSFLTFLIAFFVM